MSEEHEAQRAYTEGEERAFAGMVRLLWPDGPMSDDPISTLAHTLAGASLGQELAAAEALRDAVTRALGEELARYLRLTLETWDGDIHVLGVYHRFPLMFEWATLYPESWAALVCERGHHIGATGPYHPQAKITFTTPEEFVRALIDTLAAMRRAE